MQSTGARARASDHPLVSFDRPSVRWVGGEDRGTREELERELGILFDWLQRSTCSDYSVQDQLVHYVIQ
jgi:hypothetical protein